MPPPDRDPNPPPTSLIRHHRDDSNGLDPPFDRGMRIEANPRAAMTFGKGFRGIIKIRTFQNLYVFADIPTFGAPFGTSRPGYTTQPYDWEILPSPHGGYFLRTGKKE